MSSMPEQLPLEWGTVSEPPRARRTDPPSSHLAADRANQFLRGHAFLIVQGLLGCPGLTACELAALEDFPLTVVQIDRRTKELEAAGWIAREQTDDGLAMWPTAKARQWQTQRSRPETIEPECLN